MEWWINYINLMKIILIFATFFINTFGFYDFIPDDLATFTLLAN